VIAAVLDEEQTALPCDPQVYRLGRCQLVDNISDADLIKRLYAALPEVEFSLLPEIRSGGGEGVVQEALVQVNLQFIQVYTS
jgi:hypothetical protein